MSQGERFRLLRPAPKGSRHLCPLLGTRCGRCELKFPEPGRGGQGYKKQGVQGSTQQSAGTPPPRGLLGDRCVRGEAAAPERAVHTCSLPRSPLRWRQVHICLGVVRQPMLFRTVPQVTPSLPPHTPRGFPCLLRLQPQSLTGHMVQPALCGRGQGGRGGSEWQAGWLPWQRAWLLV